MLLNDLINRYIIQLWDMSLEGVWEGRAIYLYYTELIFELVALGVDFAHHMHMLLYGNIFLSMASLVICMQLRFIFYEFQRRIKRHKNYLRVVKDMESKFSMATQEDLEQNADDCAICWEKMNIARKLPCGHLFHNSCLRSWLEQDTSCPTCRTTLSQSNERERQVAGQQRGPNLGGAVVAPANQLTTNHFFHFDGSRYVSWLPSFSVEVTHTNLLPGQQAHATQTSQLDNMAREVLTVFPSIPQSVIMDDLRLTRSVDLTIDNILEGRIVIPQVPITASGHQRSDSFGPVSNFSSSEISPSPSLGSSVDSPRSSVLSLPNLEQDAKAVAEPPAELRQHQNSSVPNAIAGSRFSKSASERMSMLEKRKQALLEQARRAYQVNQDLLLSAEMSAEMSSSSCTDSDLDDTGTAPENTDFDNRIRTSSRENIHSEEDVRVRRRAVLLEATQRRLDRNSSS
uniref:RING-type domain-containing protein n=1 Tax=Arion vulgaris TaxID=1028688 RepID=A0A0B6ZKZ2_9EUPU